jgi:hypothetical protein
VRELTVLEPGQAESCWGRSPPEVVAWAALELMPVEWSQEPALVVAQQCWAQESLEAQSLPVPPRVLVPPSQGLAPRAGARWPVPVRVPVQLLQEHAPLRAVSLPVRALAAVQRWAAP